ncbi:MAG: hypothetical protein M1834_007370 [Cirrosporium novae-zelandiae]|nr:MAG: hypothetical protein M1834_007370 [Cirrosporium novae-zelandiae]
MTPILFDALSTITLGPHHKLPRSASTPHTGQGPPPAIPPQIVGTSRDTTVVRIPIRSAKHHFGASVSRGMRPYNEDAYQAGVIDLPAFAKRAPISLTRPGRELMKGEGTSAEGASGDPQIFYFGVFDGHGGNECSDYLRENLHGYIERAAKEFGLQSNLKTTKPYPGYNPSYEESLSSEFSHSDTNLPETVTPTNKKIADLENSLVQDYKSLIGGYFNRFRPPYFTYGTPSLSSTSPTTNFPGDRPPSPTVYEVLAYAFLLADLDFIKLQTHRSSHVSDSCLADRPLNEGDTFSSPSHAPESTSVNPITQTVAKPPFLGGSTASIALVSTPNPTPFYHPTSPSTILTAHVGDTRIILCNTLTGLPVPLTSPHHPTTPLESTRLRRSGASFISTDSFGESRLSGLANSRAFGDIRSKRLGVSSEPDVLLTQLPPQAYSFLVLMSDGITDEASDQEVVDIIKEAKTPEEGARAVVKYAGEVGTGGDNATCLVVRLGGWERRGEGGVGSLGTREMREWKRRENDDGRRARM